MQTVLNLIVIEEIREGRKKGIGTRTVIGWKRVRLTLQQFCYCCHCHKATQRNRIPPQCSAVRTGVIDESATRPHLESECVRACVRERRSLIHRWDVMNQ